MFTLQNDRAARQASEPGPLAGELRDESRKGLYVTGDPQGSGVYGLEAYVANAFCGNFFTRRLLTAGHEAASYGFPPGFKDPEKHFIRHGVERTDDVRMG